MITIRPAEERGRFDFGWLDTRHSFSFGDYRDPRHMGFSDLRVINEDRVAPAAGFGEHGHRDMEIVTYVLDGALEHKDSLGNGATIHPGEVQRMSAGTGVRHSEFNHSKDTPVHLLQIWLLPEEPGIAPGYEQKAFDVAATNGALRLVASRDGRDGSVTVHQDVALYAGKLTEGAAVAHSLAAGRRAWVQVARGTVRVNGQQLYPGDGAALTDEETVSVTATSDAEILLFDLR